MAQQLADLEAAVRSISHDLAGATWDQARAKSRISGAMVAAAVSRRPFTIWPLLPYFFICYLFMSRFMAPGSSVVVCFIAVAWAVLMALAANAVGRRWPGPLLGRYVLFVLLLLFSGPLAAMVGSALGFVPAMGTNLVIAVGVSITVVMVAGGVAHAVNVSESGVLADLEASISNAEVQAQAREREETRMQRELAIHLHGTVAANVTAATMRLRQAIDEGDVLVAKAAYVEARQLLDKDLRSTMLVKRSDLSALIRELAESWEGIAEVKVIITGGEDLPPSIVRDVVSVATEAVSNAVRHADAHAIDISISCAGSGIDVLVVDDGHAIDESARGLGSTLFDHVAPGAWSRTTGSSGGSSLRLRMMR